MAIQLKELANGFVRFDSVFLRERRVLITLELTDTDGDIQTDVIEWTATRPTELREAVQAVAGMVDAVPHWRAVNSGNELSIGPASPENTGRVFVELPQ